MSERREDRRPLWDKVLGEVQRTQVTFHTCTEASETIRSEWAAARIDALFERLIEIIGNEAFRSG